MIGEGEGLTTVNYLTVIPDYFIEYYSKGKGASPLLNPLK